MTLRDTLERVLAQHPGATVRELRELILAAGSDAPSKSELNSHLYRSQAYRNINSGGLPNRYLVASPPDSRKAPACRYAAAGRWPLSGGCRSAAEPLPVAGPGSVCLGGGQRRTRTQSWSQRGQPVGKPLVAKLG